jgi:predicted transcriptional regulator
MLEYVVPLGLLAIAVLILVKVLLPQPGGVGLQSRASAEEVERERANAAVDTIKKRMNEFVEARNREADEVMVPGGEESLERKLNDSEELSDEELLKTVG